MRTGHLACLDQGPCLRHQPAGSVKDMHRASPNTRRSTPKPSSLCYIFGISDGYFLAVDAGLHAFLFAMQVRKPLELVLRFQDQEKSKKNKIKTPCYGLLGPKQEKIKRKDKMHECTTFQGILTPETQKKKKIGRGQPSKCSTPPPFRRFVCFVILVACVCSRAGASCTTPCFEDELYDTGPLERAPVIHCTSPVPAAEPWWGVDYLITNAFEFCGACAQTPGTLINSFFQVVWGDPLLCLGWLLFLGLSAACLPEPLPPKDLRQVQQTASSVCSSVTPAMLGRNKLRKCLRRRRRRQRAQVKRGRPRLPDSRLCARAFECRRAGGTRLPKPRVDCRLSARSSGQAQALRGKGCRFRTRPASLVRALSSGRTDTSCGSLSASQVASLSAATLSLLGGNGGSAATKRKRNGVPSARQKLWYKSSLFWVDPDTGWWEPHSEKPPPAQNKLPSLFSPTEV